MSRKSKAEQFQDNGYNITVTGRHVLVTDAMKDFAQEKISKIEKFTNRIIDVTIRMDIQKLDHRVDIVMMVGNLKIKSSATTTDMYASIDQAVHKLEKQLLKYQDKLHEHMNKHLTVTQMKVNILRQDAEEIKEINDEIESENNHKLMDGFGEHAIVDSETRALKTLTTSEAIMKLDLSGDQFMIYRSEEDQRLKVIYRRKDGSLGVIAVEP